jgi:hypothetical protein
LSEQCPEARGLSLPVLFERVLVVRATVELGDQQLRTPEHVDLVAGDDLVDLGPGETVAVDEAQVGVFEDGAGKGGWVQDARQVLERSLRRRHRDAVVARGVRVRERWTRTPWCRRAVRAVTATGLSHRTSPHKVPADRWLSTAPGPHARTAAIARACGDGGRWPTA